MITTLIGQKIDQTQKFLEDGRRIPVTSIAVSANAILQVKTDTKEGYNAVQLGFGKKKKPTKSLVGHVKKAGLQDAPKIVREVRLDTELPSLGEAITVSAVFKPGDVVKVSGISKGKGFAGVVKRYKFRGGPKTHGQSDRLRAPGSIGQTTTPGRVYKGKRMAGRMGSEMKSVTNLTVVGVDEVSNVLLVSGLIPGHKNTFVTIKKTGEKKKFIPLLQIEAREEEAPQIVEEVVATEVSMDNTQAQSEEIKEEKTNEAKKETAVIQEKE